MTHKRIIFILCYLILVELILLNCGCKTTHHYHNGYEVLISDNQFGEVLESESVKGKIIYRVGIDGWIYKINEHDLDSLNYH